MKQSAEAAWERAMKVQEVILRAIAKQITWWQAAETSALAIGSCGAGIVAMKSMATPA